MDFECADGMTYVTSDKLALKGKALKINLPADPYVLLSDLDDMSNPFFFRRQEGFSL